MARRRRGGQSGGGHASTERWLLTYADMITLLLALFILLYAMSTINPKTFDSLRRSLSSEFHGQIVDGSHNVTNGSSSILASPTPADTQNQTLAQIQQESTEHEGQVLQTQTADLQKSLAKAVEASSQTSSAAASSAALTQKGVTVGLTPQGIDIRLAGDTFFEPGSATLNPNAENVLVQVATQLKAKIGSRLLSVEGHTDGVPISGLPFPNNLALSTGRALSVVDFLAGHAIPMEQMHVQGWGDERPVVNPPTPTTPEAKNRTVDIVIAAPPAAAQSALRSSTIDTSGYAPTGAAVTGSATTFPASAPILPPANPIGTIIDSVVQAGGAGD